MSTADDTRPAPASPAPTGRAAGEPAETSGQRIHVRPDFALIGQMVEPGSRVLDVGCETGELLDYLIAERGVVGRGIELSQAGVNESVRRGLSVVQGDADTDLVDYPTGAFDYVILSQTLQATRNPAEVLRNLVRIGRHAIVSFPNFGHWRVRARLALTGRMPVSEALPETWYETPHDPRLPGARRPAGHRGRTLAGAGQRRPRQGPRCGPPGQPVRPARAVFVAGGWGVDGARTSLATSRIMAAVQELC
jgi:methionine biosynthesis protein MetW